jgi:hypothetical protein
MKENYAAPHYVISSTLFLLTLTVSPKILRSILFLKTPLPPSVFFSFGERLSDPFMFLISTGTYSGHVK